MTPMFNEAVVADRMQSARQRAANLRTARAARAGAAKRAGLQSLRDAVGLGLIAIGERLVDRPHGPDPATLRRAA